jgi:hypothetical protein
MINSKGVFLSLLQLWEMPVTRQKVMQEGHAFSHRYKKLALN